MLFLLTKGLQKEMKMSIITLGKIRILLSKNTGMGGKGNAARISTTMGIRTSIFRKSTIHDLANAAFGIQTGIGLLESDVTKHLLMGHGSSSSLKIVRIMSM
uniref:hypothetical protein n=1 Tax=Candidatus Electronema sp. TaxID=2698783 RepID=UPI0040564E62